MQPALPKLPNTTQVRSLRRGAHKCRPKCTGCEPELWPPTSRGAKEATRKRNPGDTGRPPAPDVASGSDYGSTGNVGTRDAPASQAAAKAEPRPRRRSARGPPLSGGQSRVNKASTPAAHLPRAATSRPQNSGQPDRVKPDPQESDGGVAVAETAGGRGSGPRCFLRQSRPRSSGSVLRSASLPVGVGLRSSGRFTGHLTNAWS